MALGALPVASTLASPLGNAADQGATQEHGNRVVRAGTAADLPSCPHEGTVSDLPVVRAGTAADLPSCQQDSEYGLEDGATQCDELPGLVPIANRSGKAAPAEPVAASATSEAHPEQPAAPQSTEDQDSASAEACNFDSEETVFIFDWDDTVLPSTWVQCQGLRLDEGSTVSAWQRDQLTEVANASIETLRIAKQYGTVIFVTNAERGWIELSCQKFLPTLYPYLESVKMLSARTTYESPQFASPLDWKLAAFGSEIDRIYGADVLDCADKRKNVLSLGDSVHEREALLRACKDLPNCRSKSLKFVERPDISQICKQHSLVTSCFDRIVNHDGHLDLCIQCA